MWTIYKNLDKSIQNIIYTVIVLPILLIRDRDVCVKSFVTTFNRRYKLNGIKLLFCFVPSSMQCHGQLECPLRPLNRKNKLLSVLKNEIMSIFCVVPRKKRRKSSAMIGGQITCWITSHYVHKYLLWPFYTYGYSGVRCHKYRTVYGRYRDVF